MFKKQGFTLLGLLIFITTLSILGLIAIFNILKVINDAQQDFFKNSVYGIVEAAELGYTKDILAGVDGEVTFTYINGVENPSVSNKVLDYRGDKPKNGIISIDDKGRIALAFYEKGYCAVKDYSNSVITLIKKEKQECKLP
jgi:type II secretory pathway pseudopilin PulG